MSFGEQDRAHLSAADAHPRGVTAAAFCAESELLILAGPQSPAAAARELTAWRMVDEAPYLTISLSKDLPKVRVVLYTLYVILYDKCLSAGLCYLPVSNVDSNVSRPTPHSSPASSRCRRRRRGLLSLGALPATMTRTRPTPCPSRPTPAPWPAYTCPAQSPCTPSQASRKSAGSPSRIRPATTT